MTSNLPSEQLKNDPRVAQAKQLLAQALADHQRGIEQIRPSDPNMSEIYMQQLARLAQARGGATYFPYLSSGLGSGPFVQLADGSVKLDFISGIGVHGMGHSHPAMLEAAIDGALQDTIMQGNLQQNIASIEMCEQLIKLANRDSMSLEHCLLTTSGAMANENALKIAFHNRFPANRILAIDNCFAGRSIALSQLTDRPAYRTGLPQALMVDHLPMFDPRRPQASTQEAVHQLHKLLARYPGQYAALWMELVAGEGGYYPGTEAYFRALIDPCRAQRILIALDEIQTFARLSQPFAFQHFSLDQFVDIVTIGKITQVCATLYRDALKPKGPLLSQTFTANSSSITAGLTILKALEAQQCFGPAGLNMRRFEYFAARMERLASTYPHRISGPYGEGMMFAFTPADGSEDAAKRFLFALYGLGLMGFLAGHDPARIRFLPPPLITTQEHIDLACNIIEQAAASI